MQLRNCERVDQQTRDPREPASRELPVRERAGSRCVEPHGEVEMLRKGLREEEAAVLRYRPGVDWRRGRREGWLAIAIGAVESVVVVTLVSMFVRRHILHVSPKRQHDAPCQPVAVARVDVVP